MQTRPFFSVFILLVAATLPSCSGTLHTTYSTCVSIDVNNQNRLEVVKEFIERRGGLMDSEEREDALSMIDEHALRQATAEPPTSKIYICADDFTVVEAVGMLLKLVP